MAGRWANAALRDQTWPQDLRTGSGALDGELMKRVTTGALQRTVSQASTLTFSLVNGDRWVTQHEAANPFTAGSTRFVYGIPRGFELVKIDKRADLVTLTGEDAVINHLRSFKGAKAQAAGTRTFVDFAVQLCREAGVPIIADHNAAPLNSPVSRNGPTTGSSTGSDTQPEDSWACLTRMAGDRGWYCFSDGTSVIYGPGYWLMSGSPAMTIAERVGGVDIIDGSMDSGKPVSQLTVTARASSWEADPGAYVRVAAGLGPFSGGYVCEEISRQSLASDAISVTLAAPTPVKPEPAASSGTSTTKAASSAGIVGANDPNAGRAGYVKTEDGTWVPKSYYS